MQRSIRPLHTPSGLDRLFSPMDFERLLASSSGEAKSTDASHISSSSSSSGDQAARRARRSLEIRAGSCCPHPLTLVLPGALEDEYWAALGSRAISRLDAVHALLLFMMWAYFALNKLRSDNLLLPACIGTLLLSHAAFVLAAQRCYMAHRRVLLPAILAATTLLMYQMRKSVPNAAAHAYLSGCEPRFFLFKLSQSLGLVTHITSIIMHHLPYRYQVPLVLLGTAMSVRGRTLPTAQVLAAAPELMATLSACMAELRGAVVTVMELVAPLCGALPEPLDPLLSLQRTPAALVLVVQLLMGVLLPLYYRYSVEWHGKMRFLMQRYPTPAAKLQLVPAAVAACVNPALAAAQHVCWLVMLVAAAFLGAQVLQRPLLRFARFPLAA